MAVRCLVAYIPEWPFRLADLMPKRALAQAAGALQEAGHTPLIVDVGNRWAFERLAGLARSRKPSPMGPRARIDADDEMLAGEVLRDAFGPFIDGFRPQVIVLYGEAGRNGAWAGLAARHLRAMAAGAPILGWGPLWRGATASPATASAELDGWLPSNDTRALTHLAGRIGNGLTWDGVPGLHYPRGGAIHKAPALNTRFSDPGHLPVYDPGVYPALAGDGQFKVFEVEDTRPLVQGVDCTEAPWLGVPRPLADVRAELRGLAERYGARAFHLAGSDGSAERIEQIAFALSAIQPSAIYTRDMPIGAVDESLLSALLVSGACGLRLPVPSGSQRLLDDLYGAGFTVSEAERALALTAAYNQYRLIQMTYPTIEDDYHTSAESLRLIGRTQPESVSFAPPEAELALPATDGGRTTRRALARMAAVVRELGPTANTDIREAALASLIAGDHGAAYLETLRARVEDGDAAHVSREIQRVNAQGCLPRNAVPLRPFVPVRNAVGN